MNKSLVRTSVFLAALLLPAILARPVLAGIFNPETFTLGNGMQVVVIESHRAPVVKHMVWYKVGSADEAPGESGIAHLLEHLMFKGTKTVPQGAFSAAIARNGGQENAFTSYDYTAYHQTIAKDRLEMVMRMEADRMTNLQISEEQVAPERMVVLEERRSRVDNNPSSQLSEQVNAALYLNYPYRRPIIGWEHEIRALDVDRILAFYKRYYAPNNAILIIEGDVTVDKIKTLAEKYYGVIPRGPDIQRNRTIEPPSRADIRVSLAHERVQQPSWSRTFLAPSYNYGETKHAYALQMLEEILGGGPSSRFYKALVLEQGIAHSAGAYYGANDIGPSTFGFYASPKEGVSFESIEEAINAEVSRLLQDGVTEQEVADVTERVKNKLVFARDNFGTAARVFGQVLATRSSVEDVEAWGDRMAAVTVDDVMSAARLVLDGTYSVTAELSNKPQS